MLKIEYLISTSPAPGCIQNLLIMNFQGRNVGSCIFYGHLLVVLRRICETMIL